MTLLLDIVHKNDFRNSRSLLLKAKGDDVVANRSDEVPDMKERMLAQEVATKV